MADDESLESVQIKFASGALPDDKVRLRGVWGRERLSRLFEFDLLIQRQTPYTDDELDQLLKAPCAIALGPKKGDVVHGLLEHIEVVDHERNVRRPLLRADGAEPLASDDDADEPALLRHERPGHRQEDPPDVRPLRPKLRYPREPRGEEPEARIRRSIPRERLGLHPALARARGLLLLVRARRLGEAHHRRRERRRDADRRSRGHQLSRAQ